MTLGDKLSGKVSIMIAYITGQFTHKSPTYVIIEAGGLGYEIQISLQTYAYVKDLTMGKLLTHLHITADVHTLYGFASLTEKQWFLYLIGVNGIGPRMAMTILASLTPDELQQAVQHKNVAMLQSTKGVGAKAAQRIVLELSTKVAKLPPSWGEDMVTDRGTPRAVQQEALAALARLGISKSHAEKAILHVLKTHQSELPIESLIKLALNAEYTTAYK